MNGLLVRPVSRNKAQAWINEHHRKLKAPHGWLFGVEILFGGEVAGVACAGRPVARMLQDGFTAEITRVCTLGQRNACSFAYGALRQALRALGYTRVYTYTHLDESGASPRGAGFVFDGLRGGGQATRPSRPRRTRGQSESEIKVRWVWPACEVAPDTGEKWPGGWCEIAPPANPS